MIFYIQFTVSDGFVKTRIYDKRDYLDFNIVSFPFLYGEIRRSTSYLIRLAKVSSHVDDFNTDS